MASIFAEGIEINIQDGQWRMYNVQGSHSITPFFYIVRGMGLLHYAVKFGEARNLPGDVMTVDFVKAVVVGFDEKSKRWLLGLQVQDKDISKPRFIELVRWPVGDEAEAGLNSHTAGRVLAEYIGCPLKLFGVKKVPQAANQPSVTGPLEPHQRVDIDMREVQAKALEVQLPISEDEAWLGSTRDQLTLRVPKEAPGKTGETPAYNQAVIDKNAQLVRLVPPTGLLGAFFGPGGRSIKFPEVRNVELRHTILHESQLQKDSDGMDLDITQTKHDYAIYLTLKDESLMLIHVTHLEVNHLVGLQNTKTRTLADSNYENVEVEMARLRYHQRDQEKQERKEKFIESAALVIASTMNKPLAVTTVGEVLG